MNTPKPPSGGSGAGVALPPLVPHQTKSRREPAVMDRKIDPIEPISEKKKKHRRKSKKAKDHKPTLSTQPIESRGVWLGEDRMMKRNTSTQKL